MIAKKGTFHSPHYPGDYSSNNDCLYTMVADDATSRIELNFETFHLQDSKNCESDYIQVYDGDSTDSPLMYNNLQLGGRFCGSVKPPVTMSTTKVLTVRFHSNGNISKSGFFASWKKVEAKKGRKYFYYDSTFF